MFEKLVFRANEVLGGIVNFFLVRTNTIVVFIGDISTMSQKIESVNGS